MTDYSKKIRLSFRVPSYFRIGIDFGFWPCLGGPYVRLAVGMIVIELWHGVGSYKK